MGRVSPQPSGSSCVSSRSGGCAAVALSIALVLGTLLLFWPLGEAGFVNFDDPGYVYENPPVVSGLSLEGVRWAGTTFYKANWHPLTWLSHMLDVEIFGLDPGWHHLTNVALHALNVALLFFFLTRATAALWPSALVAALFAVHPLHVESVAWISERKDLLSTAFWMLSLHAYLSWVRSGGVLRYLVLIVFFAGGLLAKPMVVTLPFALLLLDFWPLSRTVGAPGGGGESRAGWPGLLAEKAPLFAMAALLSWMTLLAQTQGGAVVDLPNLPVLARLTNAVEAYGWYLGKAAWPTGLAALYPHPGLAETVVASWGWVWLLGLGFAVTLGALWQNRHRPYLIVGWLWFVGTLIPVVGFVQVGSQAMADRYSYIPLIGVFVAVAWLIGEAAAGGSGRRRVVALAAGIWLAALSSVTRGQLVHWQNARTLAARAIAVTQGNFVMEFNLAKALEAQGQLEGARGHYEEAVRLSPGRAVFHASLAALLVRQGRLDEGIARYRTALALDPRNGPAANNLAWLFATHPGSSVRDGREARRLARWALEVAPESASHGLDTLAAAQAELGDFATASRTAQRALRQALAEGKAELALEIEGRSRLYDQGEPFRDTAVRRDWPERERRAPALPPLQSEAASG